MPKDALPALRPIGPTMREVRLELGATQEEVAAVLGFGKGGQSQVSYREKDPAAPTGVTKPIEPAPVELVAFEDHYGLQRGTILRRAGYVVDADTPVDLIESWTFLNPTERQIIRGIVEQAWEKAGRPGSSRKLRPLPGARQS